MTFATGAFSAETFAGVGAKGTPAPPLIIATWTARPAMARLLLRPAEEDAPFSRRVFGALPVVTTAWPPMARLLRGVEDDPYQPRRRVLASPVVLPFIPTSRPPLMRVLLGGAQEDEVRRVWRGISPVPGGRFHLFRARPF